MSKVTPIDDKTNRELRDTYEEIDEHIRDARTISNLLSCVDQDHCQVNEAGFALERLLLKAEKLQRRLWKLTLGRAAS